MTNIEPQPSPPLTQSIVAAILLISSSALLFARLGHYALWDDEAYTALSAESVWQTGDTGAILGHNIVAYHEGTLLRNLHDRYQLPVPPYIAAPFVGLLGNTSLAPRLPFAALGLACIAFIAWWLHRAGASTLTWIVLAIVLLTNVSLLLYFRQARYYAVVMLLTIWLTYLYLNWNGGRGWLVGMAILSVLLLGSHLLDFIAFWTCVAIDYAIWGRRRRALTWGDVLAFVLPQLVLGGALLWVWNPIGLDPLHYHAKSWLLDRITLLGWNLRELSRNEMVPLIVLLTAPVVWWFTRKNELLFVRAPLAALVFIVMVTLLSPQPVENSEAADVRYLAPLMPLGVVVAAAWVIALAQRRAMIAIPVAVIGLGTNLLYGGVFFPEGMRVTLAYFINELADPPRDCYTVTARWIDQNVRDGQSIYVLPQWMAYPLIYHEPKAIYAWQLRDPPQSAQFRGLPDIFFVGRVPVDFIISFGPTTPFAGRSEFSIGKGWHYRRIAVLDVFGKDVFRPELIWREFDEVKHFDPQTQGVSIFRRE